MKNKKTCLRKTIVLLSLTFSLFAISSCNKDVDVLTTQKEQMNASNTKGGIDNKYQQYEIYDDGDTINGTLLIKFKDEVALENAEDKPTNLAIWQMETYFNIKYGLKDGIDGKFGGEIKDSRQFEFKVASYTKGTVLYQTGKELIGQYIIVRDSIYTWLQEKEAGLVLADFKVIDVKDGYTTFAIQAIGGAVLAFPISPKRILCYGQECPYPADFETKYTHPFTIPNNYAQNKTGGDWGYNVVLNPNQYPVCVTCEYIPIWTNVLYSNYAWYHNDEYHQDPNHQNLQYSMPWSLMCGALNDNNAVWNKPLPNHTNPEELFNLYKEYFITPDYHGYNDVILFWILSGFNNNELLSYNHFVYYLICHPTFIPNSEYSQL